MDKVDAESQFSVAALMPASPRRRETRLGRNVVRNVNTAFGKVRVGNGVPFRIYLHGVANINSTPINGGIYYNVFDPKY